MKLISRARPVASSTTPAARRHRTIIAVVGSMAAVAIIGASAALATDDRDDDGDNAPTAQAPTAQAPNPSPTTGPTRTGLAQPAPGVLDVSDLPTGAKPQMEYVHDDTLHLTDGVTVRLGTAYAPHRFVTMADGSRVWQTLDHGRTYVEIQDADGSFHDPLRSDWGLSANRQRSIVAWLTMSGQVTIWEGWASEPRPLGDPVPGSDLRLGPVTGVDVDTAGQAGPDCATSSCTVIVNVADSTWQPWEVAESGTQPVQDGGFLSIVDQNEVGLTIGFDEITDFGSCSKLLGGGEFEGWSTCDHTLVSFSPDGSTVLADPAYHDGIGHGRIAMYESGSGKLRFSRTSNGRTQAFYNSAAWEDNDHVLVPVFQQGWWSIVRVGSNGFLEYAVEPVRGKAEQNPFVVAMGA